MTKYFGTMAMVCLVFAVVAILGSVQGIKDLPPPGPERQGYITATILIPAVLLTVAVVLYLKRTPRP